MKPEPKPGEKKIVKPTWACLWYLTQCVHGIFSCSMEYVAPYPSCTSWEIKSKEQAIEIVAYYPRA